jgi:nitrite reductase/ring-hydroxylating ferredoxin subunit/uncharacterized membrane protein
VLKDLLQGKPLRHPLHPALIHLPVSALVLSLLLDLATWLAGGGNHLVRGAFYTMAFGVATALVAAVPGFVDRSAIRTDHPARRIVNYHMALNLAAVGLYALNLALRWHGSLEEARTPALPLALSFLGMGVLAVSGYLGGTLVYDQGIAVGRHRRTAGLPTETVRVSGDPAREWVPVGDAQGLHEGHTLRVEAGGTVMAVVRLGGEVYAFQEFCTHRFGPLSEGTFQGGQVMCPWHRSCFDVRTGKVTQGPAKVDLRVFEVRVEEGQILVRVPPA